MNQWISDYLHAQKAAHDSIPLDAVAELILDVDALDPGLVQVLDEANVEPHAGSEQGSAVASGEDVTRERRVLMEI